MLLRCWGYHVFSLFVFASNGYFSIKCPKAGKVSQAKRYTRGSVALFSEPLKLPKLANRMHVKLKSP